MRLGGCLAVAFALLASWHVPIIEAHDDSSSRIGDVEWGVSGVYTGSAGAFVSTSNYSGKMTCDREVAGDGTAPQPADEAIIDGGASGSAPDGTWDDGGRGGACHTTHYAYAPYNTPGCPADGARAHDTALAGTVWIGAACDWLTVTIQGQAFLCPEGAANGNIRCASPGPNPDPCSIFICTWFCGPDGQADAINFGPGGTRIPYPSVPQDECIPSVGTAEVFVFDQAGKSATSGRIWQVA